MFARRERMLVGVRRAPEVSLAVRLAVPEDAC
jgi:hypothetical protein